MKKLKKLASALDVRSIFYA